MMFQYHKLSQCYIDLKLTKENDKQKIEKLVKEKTSAMMELAVIPTLAVCIW